MRLSDFQTGEPQRHEAHRGTSPFERAAWVYEREVCARSFEADLLLHFEHGYVVSTPEAFAMVRRVWHDWPDERLQTPWETAVDGDCWWVWLVAGRLSVAAHWLPCELPWLGYERGNVPLVRRAGRVLALAM